MASQDDDLFSSLQKIQIYKEVCMRNRASKFISIVLAVALLCTSVICVNAAEPDSSTVFEASGLTVSEVKIDGTSQA